MFHKHIALGAALVLGLGTAASAHVFPKKAKLIKSALIQTYPECTTPDTTTSSGRQACEGPAEVDPVCIFGDNGSGLLLGVIKDTGIKVKALVKGLDAACDGTVLTAAFRIRTTTDDCPTDHCTAVDEELVTTVTCTVAGGECLIKDTIPTNFPAGAGSAMQVLSCGVKNGSLLTLSCGIMVP
jgi:hypothetical protein